jgi:DNA-binding NtrC family response regulator
MDPMVVLIVDDEEDLVSALVERLEMRGIEAVGVQSGAEAVRLVGAKAFDVVVLDVKLQGEDGVDVMKRIKQIHPQLPVILLTGHMSKETSEEGFRAGAIDYIIKPIQIDDLLGKMREAITLFRK